MHSGGEVINILYLRVHSQSVWVLEQLEVKTDVALGKCLAGQAAEEGGVVSRRRFRAESVEPYSDEERAVTSLFLSLIVGRVGGDSSERYFDTGGFLVS